MLRCKSNEKYRMEKGERVYFVDCQIVSLKELISNR